MGKLAKKPKARADGEGSIFQRADGKWVAQVQFIGADGKRKVKTKVATTQGEARRKLTTMKGDQDAHRLVVSGRASVKDWLDVWLAEFIKPNRAETTHSSYYDVIKGHLSERIAKMPLERIAPEDLQRQFNTVAAAGHGSTADLLRRVLRSAFNKAVKLKRMPSNPVLATDPVQYVQREMATFTPESAVKFLEAAERDRYGCLCALALSLGLRKGEVGGLKPEDVDLESGVLHVQRQLQWIKPRGEDDEQEGRWLEKPCKRNSRRDLPLTETLKRALSRHMARRRQEAATAKSWNDSGYLFVSVTGAPLHQSNVTQAFRELCTAAKVPIIRFHDTRHSCGTLLHAQGADPFVIQRVLGHSQLSTTRRYTHVPIEVTRTAVTGLEALIEAERKKQQEKQERERQAAAAEANHLEVQPQTTLVQ